MTAKRNLKPITNIEAKEQLVKLRVICISPPDPERYGAVFGLQDNSTAKDWVIQRGSAKENGDIHFECECRVRRNAKTNQPNFLGQYVHGDTQKRFLYLSWRPKDWQPGDLDTCATWLRRMKIHLSSISWEQIKKAATSGNVLEATVAGRGRDGGPNCASVTLEHGGWKLKKV